VKKPRKKAASKKKVVEGEITSEVQVEKKSRVRKTRTTQKTSDPAATETKKSRAKKPKIADET
jgi:hypothetical protein